MTQIHASDIHTQMFDYFLNSTRNFKLFLKNNSKMAIIHFFLKLSSVVALKTARLGTSHLLSGGRRKVGEARKK